MTGGAETTTGPLALLRTARLIPVLTITDEAHAVPLARALVAGGVKTLEITLRTAAGAAAARRSTTPYRMRWSVSARC